MNSAHTPSSLTAWERWELASFDQATASAPPLNEPTASQPAPPLEAEPALEAELNQLREAAYAKGYQDGFEAGQKNGHAAGQQAALAEGREQTDKLIQLFARFNRQIDDLESNVANDLLALALEIARKVTHQTIATQPKFILRVIHDALAQLPLQRAVIFLNPADIASIDALGSSQLTQAGHRLQADANLAPGDVVIQADNTRLDARIATRWQQVIAAFGADIPWDAQTPPQHHDPATPPALP
ncbi:MAG: flagellar assembly protein FliH [Rugosibacter sp.]|jgi:flagellar assembly protein FliH|nr:flagellar assembly protein FliH [Rugosibacter sp.]